jgi:hypothetical protein
MAGERHGMCESAVVVLAQSHREWRCFWIQQRFPVNREPDGTVRLTWLMATAHRQPLAVMAYLSVDIYPTLCYTSALDVGEWAASVPFRFTLHRVSRPHCSFWLFGEETNFVAVSRIQELFRPSASRSLATMLTELGIQFVKIVRLTVLLFCKLQATCFGSLWGIIRSIK